jgi:hypothetical protein
MRERREIIKLAGQLQQGSPLQPSALAKFIEDHQLSSEEVAMLQGELISNIVVLFSTQQATTALLRQHKPVAVTAPSPSVPSLAQLPDELLSEAIGQPLYQAGDPVPWYGTYQRRLGTGLYVKRSDGSGPMDAQLESLYSFPYDPQAYKQARAGGFVRYYYPSKGLDLVHVDQIALIDANTGSLQLSNGKLIPLTYITGIFDKNLS